MRFSTCLFCMVAVISLSGCQSKDSEQLDKIEARLDKLESEIKSVDARTEGRFKGFEHRLLTIDAGSQGRSTELAIQIVKLRNELTETAKILQESIQMIADHVTAKKSKQ